MGKRKATREQKRAFLLELRCQWLENGKSLKRVSLKRLRHLYKVGSVPKEQLSMLLEKGAVTDQIIDEFETMVTEYFRKENEKVKTLKKNTQPTDPMDYPMAPLPPFYNEPRQTSIDFTSADMEKLLGQLAAGVYGIRDKDGNDIPLPEDVRIGVLEMVANCVRMWGRIPNYKAFKIEHDAILAK